MKKLFYFLFVMPLMLLACEAADEGNGGDNPSDTEVVPGDDETPTETPEEVLSWSIVGSMTNDWDAKSAIEMTLDEGYYTVKGLSIETSDVFIFVKGDYEESYGGNGRQLEANCYYPAISRGSNIRVKSAGTFDIYLNEALTHFYIMTEGKSPVEAEDGNKPVVVEWFIGVGDEAYKMYTDGDFAVVQDVALGEDGRFSLYNSKGQRYGAEGEFEINKPISVVIDVDGIAVMSEVDKLYDIYYHKTDNLVWVVEDGDELNNEVVWDSVTGSFFTSTNFLLSFESQKLKFYFDVNSGVAAQNRLIPEGIYYVQRNDNDGGNYFNCEEWVINDCGSKTFLNDGYMEVKHISGGYDIHFNITSILLKEYDHHYVGPVKGIAMLGNPVQNPE